LHKDPLDPRVFSDATLNDASIRQVCRNTKVVAIPRDKARHRFSATLTVRLKDGRELTTDMHEFPGMPSRPLSREELRAKFLKLTADTTAFDPEAVFGRLEALENQESVTPILD
jgi:2-methylcitrate dehydratase PrpD